MAAVLAVGGGGLVATCAPNQPQAGAAAASWLGGQTSDGLVKGTYVESPNRVGPFASGKGDLYFMNEVSEANPDIQMLKSADGGKTWKEVDAAHRPRGRDLESVDIEHVGTRLAIAHQRSGGNVYFHLFRTSTSVSSPDTWQIDTEDVATKATDAEQAVAISVFPDYSAVQLYAVARSGGHRIAYRIRSSGTWKWGAEQILDDGVGETFGVTGMMDSRGTYHVFYSSTSKKSLYYRTMTSSGALSAPKTLTTKLSGGSSDTYPIIPAVTVWPGGAETIMVGWMTASFTVETAAIPVGGGSITTQTAGDQAVARDYGTSRMPVASLAAYGDAVYLVYSDASSLDIWGDRWSGSWGTDVKMNNGVTAHWVRALVRDRPASQGGGRVLGYVWDMGSNGHAGDSRYFEFAVS